MENKMAFIEKPEVPNYIMKDLRQRRELDENDTSEDAEILAMSGFEFFDEWLKWNGFLGYTRDFLDVIYAAYGIDLTEYPFDEQIERTYTEE
jgi:hypothetical protein